MAHTFAASVPCSKKKEKKMQSKEKMQNKSENSLQSLPFHNAYNVRNGCNCTYRNFEGFSIFVGKYDAMLIKENIFVLGPALCITVHHNMNFTF